MRRPDPYAASRWPYLACLVGGLAVLVLWNPWTPAAADRAVRPSPEAAAVEVAGVAARLVRGHVPGAPTVTVVPLPVLEPPVLPTPSAVPATPTPTALPVPTATPDSDTGRRLQVAGTGGAGVVLHSAPSRAARVPAGFLEGAGVTLLDRSGEWAHVRGDNGLEGWVPAQYLTSAE